MIHFIKKKGVFSENKYYNFIFIKYRVTIKEK